MARRSVRLRTILVVIPVAAAALAVALSAALIVFTSAARERTRKLVVTTENQRRAQRAELDLFLIDQAVDPVVRDEVTGALQRTLAESRADAETDSDRAVIDAASAHVEAYQRALAAGDGSVPEARIRAHLAIDTLIDRATAKALAAEAGVRALTRGATALGLFAALLPGLAAIGIVVWLRTRAFRPLVRFLGGIAHDLRSPVSALKLAVGALGPERPLPPEPRLRRTLGLVARQLDRLDRMIGDLLDLSRIEAGQLELRLRRIDLRPLVRDVVELAAVASPHHRFVVEAAQPVMIPGDDGRIEQVLGNLLSNATKYSPDGGEVRVRLAATPDEATIAVTDEGIGMTDEEQARLFGPFERLEGGRRETGTGLGLYVARRIVEAHGGRIEVMSQPGKGSTFTVRLPRTEPG